MAKKRPAKHEEVMLIPFLDILCSLIGVLILIIVVLCVAQVKRARGRTQEEVALSQKYQNLRAELAELEKAAEKRLASASAEERRRLELEEKQRKLAAEIADKQRRLVELRRRLDLNAEEARTNKDKAAQAQKAVEDLLAQLEAMEKSRKPLADEVALLKKQLAERQKKPDEKPASVVVQPSGSGEASKKRLFFVESNGAGISFRHQGDKPVRVARDSVGVSPEYNEFLKSVKDTGNSALVFLVRRDGWWSYQRAAGWAEQSFELSTSKLPIPGDGPIDLGLFGKP